MYLLTIFCPNFSATVLAIRELTQKAEEYDENFVIVLSDANFDRYGNSELYTIIKDFEINVIIIIFCQFRYQPHELWQNSTKRPCERLRRFYR